MKSIIIELTVIIYLYTQMPIWELTGEAKLWHSLKSELNDDRKSEEKVKNEFAMTDEEKKSKLC